MFYVSSKNDKGQFGVTDTTDGVEDFFQKEKLLEIESELKLDIDGVDIKNNAVCIVKPEKETLRLFQQGKVHLAISTMTLNNTTFGLHFESKPTGGEMHIISRQCINISRRGVNYYSYDLGYSKSYRSGLTLDDIMAVVGQFSSWRLKSCKIGSY